MRAFFIGLQFLTRIHLVRQDNWTEEDFGKSLRYFPLIGAVLGFCYAFLALALAVCPALGLNLPPHFSAALILAFIFYLTGGIFADGFMDTMDGLFSNRGQEEMLAIMKDSRAGSGAVLGFVLLALLDFALLLDVPKNVLPRVLFIMPIISRFALAVAIKSFPYARPQGLGKAFHDGSENKTLLFAALSTLMLLLPFGLFAVLPLLLGFMTAFLFARYVTQKLGGLTGDVYGALALLCETVVLLSVCF